MWLLAAGCVTAVLVLVLVVLVSRIPSPSSSLIALDHWPSVFSLYGQALRTLLTKSFSGSKPEVLSHRIQVNLLRATPPDVGKAARYQQLADFDALPGGEVPMTFPLVESFRLTMQALLAPDFPFNVLGSVLARNVTVMHKPIVPGKLADPTDPNSSTKLVYQVGPPEARRARAGCCVTS